MHNIWKFKIAWDYDIFNQNYVVFKILHNVAQGPKHELNSVYTFQNVHKNTLLLQVFYDRIPEIDDEDFTDRANAFWVNRYHTWMQSAPKVPLTWTKEYNIQTICIVTQY